MIDPEPVDEQRPPEIRGGNRFEDFAEEIPDIEIGYQEDGEDGV